MAEQIVASDTAEEAALATASIDRERNGSTNDNSGTLVGIGGGVFLTAGHVLFQYVNPDSVRTADAYHITVGEGLDANRLISVDDSLFGTTFTSHGWGTEGGADMASVVTADGSIPVAPASIRSTIWERVGSELVSYPWPKRWWNSMRRSTPAPPSGWIG